MFKINCYAFTQCTNLTTKSNKVLKCVLNYTMQFTLSPDKNVVKYECVKRI